MANSTVEFEFGYDARNKAILASALSAMQKDVGGRQRPWGMRGGAIDLLTFLEIGIVFVAGATLGEALKKYFSGLSGAARAEKLGERHREIVIQWLGNVRSSLKRLIVSVNQQFRKGMPTPKFQGKEEAVAVRFQVGEVECFVVLNGPHVSLDSLERIPEAIGDMLEFVAQTGLPDDSTVVQLCLDPVSAQWRYLLVPSHGAFGRFVDRVVDLSTGEVLRIGSRQEFIKLLQVAKEDGLKFLVDPYRNSY
jgi:hypothetical protein